MRTPTAADVLKALSREYVDESHIEAFAQALQADDILEADPPDLSPSTSTSHLSLPSSPNTQRVRKVSALSDFAPVNMHIKKKRRKSILVQTDKRTEWTFILVRWPLLLGIFAFMAFEFSLYIMIRQLVNFKEYILGWRGRKGQLRKKLRAVQTYEDWKVIAKELDEYLKFDAWKLQDEDRFYDYKLVRKVKRSLRTLREKNDVRGVLGVLETCIRANFAGVESARLYSETFLGSKNLVESYFDEQETALKYIRESYDLSNDEKRRFFKSANTNFGTSALCLSGGGSFGYYHFGVVKAFLKNGLMPRVVTGTSAGGLIAALVCTHTDAELNQLLVPELATRITACEEPFRVWFRRFLKTGARFDSISWARKCTFFTRGSMTFKEAYQRTGRILNISVIPADQHSPTKLLNYVTAPDTIIWSALIASAAVPGILNPVVLMQKTLDNRAIPWNWGTKFKDGSLRVDIPTQALNLFFNVTHPVVSQVNPHIHLFFFAPRGSAGKPIASRQGKGWRGNFLLSATEQWLKLELTKNFKVIRDLELLPPLLGQDWSSVFLQRFDGAVTIWPKTRAWDWTRILSDPDPKELQRMMHVGQSVTWPKLHMIENRHRIEQQIFMGRQSVRRITQSQTPGPSTSKADSAPSPRPDLKKTLQKKDPYDSPIPVDSDAEAAYASGKSRRLRGKSSRLSRSSQLNLNPPEDDDIGGSAEPNDLRSPAVRRKWTSKLLGHNPEDDSHRSVHESGNGHITPPSPTITPPSPKQSFFTRVRTRSFGSLISPFTLRKLQEREVGGNERDEFWSSESSADEDELNVDEWRHLRHPSTLNINPG